MLCVISTMEISGGSPTAMIKSTEYASSLTIKIHYRDLAIILTQWKFAAGRMIPKDIDCRKCKDKILKVL